VDELAYCLAGLVVGLGCLIAFFWMQRGKAAKKDRDHTQKVRQLEFAEHSLSAENQILKEEIKKGQTLESELRGLLQESERERIEKATLNDELNKKIESQLDEQRQVAKQMQERFENLANKILEQKSAKFTEANKENLKNVLAPLDKDIRNFRKKVEDLHEKESNQHAALREFLTSMQQSQAQLSQDAKNLTSALKGDSKKQGDWGEFVLERTLEASGLIKNQEFSLQSSYEGQRPDAVIHLPENRHIIVDAKVSLTAYERAISTQNEEDRSVALKEHLVSVKKHVDELSKKDYSSIEQISSPDFVLMFIPIEPAFGAAIVEDPELYQFAFDRKIILVTSSTLMATIKTVANLWKLEKQNKHASDIAKRAGLLYDKFAGFAENMEDIGKALNKACEAQSKAIGQLSSGPGNLVGQVEKLRAMGIRTKKNLPTSLLGEIEEGD